MSLQRQITFWLILAALTVVFLFVFRSILLPFVAGMALAYCLDPIADWFEARGFSRMASTLTILAIFVLMFILFLLVLIPVVAEQLFAFIENFPGYIERLRTLANDWLPDSVKELLRQNGNDLPSNVPEVAGSIGSWLTSILTSLLSGGQSILNIGSLFVVTPIVAFYLLYDWDRMVAKFRSWLPQDHAPTIEGIFKEIDDVLAGFIRGQGLVCATLAIFYTASLLLVGLNFAVLIGMAAGILSFIPYVGSTIGLVFSVGVAVVQFWPEWHWILLVLAIFVAGQLLEGYVFQPKFIGDRVGLHPVTLMFALFAFGSLFNFVGLLIAVPAAAAIGVLVRFSLQQYLQSPYYQGKASDDGEQQ